MQKLLQYLKDPLVQVILCFLLIIGIALARCIFGEPPTEEDKQLGVILSIITATF